MEISQLFIFPVKSLRGISVEQATLTNLGLKYDRHWMIVDQANKFVTQRKHPKMVLIKTRLSKTHLHLFKEGMPEIAIPLTSFSLTNSAFLADIWNDQCMVVDEGETVSRWLSDALESNKPLRLVRMASEHNRPQSKPERFGEENTTQFADAVSYLICNQTSLNLLNSTLSDNGFSQCNIEQFRPNIVIKDSDKQQLLPFHEHNTQQFKHTDYSFVSRDACQRCIVPTIDLNSAQKHPKQEPYKTLVKLNPMPDNPKAPAFGQNATLESVSDNAVIKVGDEIIVS